MAFHVSAQSLIYSENFGRANGANGTADPSTYNWSGLAGNTTTVSALGFGTAFAVSANVGKPIDAPQINAGTNLQGTEGLGVLFSTINTANYRYLLTTNEYVFNPADYSALTFSWYGANSVSGTTQRLAVQIGGTWYATSNQTFSVPVATSGANFTTNATQHSVNFYTAAWSGLTTSGSLQLGSTTSLPSGNLTAFGVYSEFGTAGVNRIDTFQILATPIPEPTTALALLVAGGAGYFLIRRRRA